MSTPFTTAQMASIRQYLGFSELFHDIDPRLEGVMQSLPTTSPDAQNLIVGILASLADIDSRITAALSNLTLTKAEDVNFRGPGELEGLREQGRIFIGRMAITFQIEPRRDYYAPASGFGGEFGLG